YPAPEEDAEIDHYEHGCGIEHDLRSRRPQRDLAPPLTPHEEDEERDGDEERDTRDRVQRREGGVEGEGHYDARDGEDDQETAQRRVHVHPEALHRAVTVASAGKQAC